MERTDRRGGVMAAIRSLLRRLRARCHHRIAITGTDGLSLQGRCVRCGKRFLMNSWHQWFERE